MKLTILALLVLVGVVYGNVRVKRSEPIKFGEDLVNAINNNPESTFKARRYEEFEGLSNEELRQKFSGVLTDPKIEDSIERQKREISDNQDEEIVSGAVEAIPESFDISNKWPQCKSIFESFPVYWHCAPSWGTKVVEVINDRRCIRYNSTAIQRISLWDLIGCCTDCIPAGKTGCGTGYVDKAFEYYVNTGIVTGGVTKGGTGCKPFALDIMDDIPYPYSGEA